MFMTEAIAENRFLIDRPPQLRTRSMRAFALWCAMIIMSAVAVLSPVTSHAQDQNEKFTVPPLTGPVVDDARILNPRTRQAIENALRALQEQHGSQITVLTVPSLGGLPIEQASIKVTDAWKLGGRKSDNGVLLFIAPKERRMRIEVGQGLEGVLTDADSKRIIAEGITPLFKAGDFDSGVMIGVYQIARKTDPGIDISSYLEGTAQRSVNTGHSPIKPWVIILLIILFIFFNSFRGPRIRRGPFGGWGGGGWGGGLGGGGFGGGGGGGWSGGGGGFSGGGASGDW